MKLLLTLAVCGLIFWLSYKFVYTIIEMKDSERNR